MTQRIYDEKFFRKAGIPGRPRREIFADGLEAAAKLVSEAQIFHCWGDKEIDGRAVQTRLAEEIRSLKDT